jgi:separase
LKAIGVYDPKGPALHYLLAGAPFVLGNLWDVTDKDIDKLSIECMKSVFGAVDDDKKPISGEVCEALVVSRNVCKLKNAVGCAPVVYGLPYRISSSRDVVNLITT